MQSPAPQLAPGAANAATLTREIDWFLRVINARVEQHFDMAKSPFALAPAPNLQEDSSAYAATVRELDMTADERIVLMLALMPHVRPQALDIFLTINERLGKPFTEFGGRESATQGGFLPTCETAAFILAGDDLARRFAVLSIFGEQHVFTRRHLLRLEPASAGEAASARMLMLNTEYVQRFTTGGRHVAGYSGSLPASMVTTSLVWDDLMPAPEAQEELNLLSAWLGHQGSLLRDQGMERAARHGYRCLFTGPSGTGKTLAATLLGVTAGVGVCRIDLSMLAIQDIAQTKLHVAQLFDQAEEQRWILNFDAAGILFDKHTPAHAAISQYVLQRIDDFAGLVILSMLHNADIDAACASRCDSVIRFALPDSGQRLQLWRKLMSDPWRLAADVDLPALAERYELAGGAIMNVFRYAALCATRTGAGTITEADLLQGIAREMRKHAGSGAQALP